MSPPAPPTPNPGNHWPVCSHCTCFAFLNFHVCGTGRCWFFLLAVTQWDSGDSATCGTKNSSLGLVGGFHSLSVLWLALSICPVPSRWTSGVSLWGGSCTESCEEHGRTHLCVDTGFGPVEGTWGGGQGSGGVG